MASTHTLTGNVYDLTGATLGATGVRVTVVTNLPAKSALIDKTTNSIHLGGKHADLDPSTGLFTIELIDTSATDLNVAANTLEYEVRAEYVNPATRVRSTWTSGWFPFTAPANLADITTDVEPLAVESASTYALEAKGYRDEAEAISGLTGEDAAVAFLVEDSGSATAGALSNTIAAGTRRVQGLVPNDQTAPVKAANAAKLAAAMTPNGSVVIPSGNYYTDEVTIVGPVNIVGEDITTTLRNNSGGVFAVSGTQINVSTLTVRGTGGHTIRQTGTVDQSHWDRVKLFQESDGYSIWNNAGFPFVDMRFSNFLSWHTQSATVPTWHLVGVGGAINANRWEAFRQQFTGNYAFWIESTDTNAQLDNEWIKPTWEVCTGGYIRLISCRDYLIDGGGSYDMQIGTPTKLQRHGIYATANASAVACIGKIRGHRRYDSTTPEAGIFDIKLPASNKGDGTMLEDCRNISSGAPLLVDLDSNVVMVLQTSGAASSFTTYSNTAGMALWGKDGIALPSTQSFKVGTDTAAKGFKTNVVADPGSIAANSELDVVLTVTGAVAGDACTVSTGSALEAGIGIVGAWATANTVTFRLRNFTAAAIDPAGRTWRVAIHR